jgi:uncharacterized protein YjbI with pentapeptide repeats
MQGAKIVTITPSLLKYEGDYLGNDFFFHLVVRDQSFIHRDFQLKLRQDNYTDIRHFQLGIQFDYPDYVNTANIPFSLIAIETENNVILNKASDFGHGLGLLHLNFENLINNPTTSVYKLPVTVYGDYLANSGKEKGKLAQIVLVVDVEVRFDESLVSPSDRIITLFERGRRIFDGEMLQNIDLRDIALPAINFGGANLSFANFDGSDLYKSNFNLAICVNAIFTNTHLRRAVFSEANLTTADFSNAEADEADFTYTQINSVFKNTKLTYTNFQDSHIRATTFENANLAFANFGRATLDYVDFRGANLTNADFRKATLNNINYENAILDGVLGLDVPSTNFDPIEPFEGKSREYRRGYLEGYQRGYPQSSQDEIYDKFAWQKSLALFFSDASVDFNEGYEKGFMESYDEGFFTKGQ